MNVFIIGYGDIGQRVARICLAKQFSVTAMLHRNPKTKILTNPDVLTLYGDLDDPSSLTALPLKNHTLFYFAPPPTTGQLDSRVRNLLVSLSQLPQKVVLISTTAVYGDCHGAWIDETAAVKPQTERGLRRLNAEQQFQHWAATNNIPLVILRVGGIYGPKRLPLQRLQSGQPILKEAESPYTNRIHEDDLASICVAAAEHTVEGCFNVSDGHPGTMSRYFKEIAVAVGLPIPKEVDMETARRVMSAGMLSYLQESRRLKNDKLLQTLQIKLKYPDFKIGLKNCIDTLFK